MKICLMMAGIGEGGLEGHVVELSNKLAKEREVEVIAHPDMLDRFDKNVVTHPLDLAKGRSNPLILYRLIALIKSINPDVVHAHANKAVTMLARIRPLFTRTDQVDWYSSQQEKAFGRF